MPAQVRGSLLVIGIGSDLHGDDAAGRMVAARIEARSLDGVRVRSVVQLVPELVEDLATCATVVFVDADPGCAATTMREIRAASGTSTVTHHTTPAGLLQLAGSVGVTVPRAVLVGVPARCLGLGSPLSAQTRAGVDLAVEAILQLVVPLPAVPGTA